jgi:hypothetical protein
MVFHAAVILVVLLHAVLCVLLLTGLLCLILGLVISAAVSAG